MKKIPLLVLLWPLIFFSQVQIGETINGVDIDQFGVSTALSSDGTIVAVGANFGDGTNFNSGYVRVFENINDSWIQLGNDINGLEMNGQLGWSVDLSSDGTRVVIGAVTESGTSEDSGVVKIYEFQNDNWVQLGNTLNGINPLDQFGRSVAISSNGTIVAVGAMQNDANGSDSGQARMYQFQNNNWVQLGSEINGDNQFNRFGYSIDLSADGTKVAVGAPFSINPGVKVYEFQGNDWILLGNRISEPTDLEQLGHSLSLSNDGLTIAIGAPGNNTNGNNSGSVRVYKFEADAWQQQGNSIIGQAEDDNLGWSTSMSSDGNIIASGAFRSDANGLDSGQALIYENDNNTWIQVGSEINGEAIEDNFGNSIAISGDGTTVAIGGYRNNEITSSSGQVRVFDLTDPLSINEFQNTLFNIFPNPTKYQFTIQLNNTSILERVSVYNVLGQHVLSSEDSIVNTSKLASGSYIVEVTTNQGKSTKKLIID